MSSSHFWKRSGAQDMTILLDLPDLGLQVFEIISKIIDLDVTSGIFEIISKTWSPNPVFLKYFEKYGGPSLDFFKYLQKYKVTISDFYTIFGLGPNYGFLKWCIYSHTKMLKRPQL